MKLNIKTILNVYREFEEIQVTRTETLFDLYFTESIRITETEKEILTADQPPAAAAVIRNKVEKAFNERKAKINAAALIFSKKIRLALKKCGQKSLDQLLEDYGNMQNEIDQLYEHFNITDNQKKLKSDIKIEFKINNNYLNKVLDIKKRVKLLSEYKYSDQEIDNMSLPDLHYNYLKIIKDANEQ